MNNEVKEVKGIHLISYANLTFRKAQIFQSLRAISLGFNGVMQFSPNDLPMDFRNKNSETLEMERGAGYWLWKPAIIMNYSQRQDQGINLLYLDSGCLPKKSSDAYSKLVKDERIHVWTIGNLPLRNWIDLNAVSDLEINKNYGEAPMVWAGAILARNSKLFENFCELWLRLCENPKYLRPETLSGYKKPDELIWHRHDQSLLSIIVFNHPEWFVVHHDVKGAERWDLFFDRPRKLNPNFKILYLNLYKFRKTRQYFIDHAPKRIRIFLRQWKAKLDKKSLSAEEIQSLKTFY